MVGAGALGLYYGAMLQRAGHDVHFLLRRDLQAISANGLQVRSIHGDFHLPELAGHADCRDIGRVDLVLVGLKTFANPVMTELVAPLVGQDTAILTLQNGLGNEELLSAAFGVDAVLGGIAFLCANRGEPGTVLHLGEGRIRLGEAAGGRSARAEALAALFCEAGIPCEAVADLHRARWEKLVWNIPFNGLCALTGKDVTDLLAHPPSARLVEDMMQEVVLAANRQGLDEPLDGEIFIPNMLEMTSQMGHYRPSMMLDRLEGRPLELESIYSIPLKRARQRGLLTPRIEMLYALLGLGEASSG